MKLSVIIPTYKSLKCLGETLDSVLKQTFTDYEIIICNDSPTDHEDLRAFISALHDSRIRYFTNEKNLGYPLNLRRAVNLSTGEYVFLLGQDDLILDLNHFAQVTSLLDTRPEIGAITRPYYWFMQDASKALRQIPTSKQEIVTVDSEAEDILALIETLGQLSGLVYRRANISEPFHENVFPAHIYPFLSIFRSHPVYIWRKYSIAVRIESSQTRFLSSIYSPSPTKTWVEMFQRIFAGKQYDRVRKICIRHMTRHFVGLAQIKNYGHFRDLLTDIYFMAYFNPRNFLSLRFYLFSLGAILLPRAFLRKLVDFYKNKVLASTIRVPSL